MRFLGRCPTQQKKSLLTNKDRVVPSRTAGHVSREHARLRELYRFSWVKYSQKHLCHRSARAAPVPPLRTTVRFGHYGCGQQARTRTLPPAVGTPPRVSSRSHTQNGVVSGSRFPALRTCQGWRVPKMALGMSLKTTGPQTPSSFTTRGALKAANAK